MGDGVDELTYYPPVVALPIESVTFCTLFERREKDSEYLSTSLPGHLLQLTVAGECEHEIGGRKYQVSEDTLVWYQSDELVRTRVVRSVWRMYSLHLMAPVLVAPPFEARVRRDVGPVVRHYFEETLRAWRDVAVAPFVRQCRVLANVMGLLGALDGGSPQPYQQDPQAALWWQLESQVRRDLSVDLRLPLLVEWSGKSVATITRSCRAAVGTTPMQRVRQIRLDLARGLVKHSAMAITEIADRVGYGRVHELSRDYRRAYGVAPTHDRTDAAAL